ncbi:MAG: hypothetical protein ACYDH9_17445 [Limisphaerales bacterium]
MLRLFRNTLIACAVVGGAHSATAFSLLGPLASWQTSALNYGWSLGGTTINIGAPKNIGEAYRWNMPTIYYGVDRAFLEYFGTNGAAEIDKAMKMLNDLPPASEINPDNYPLRTERINYRAQALGMIDLKTATLQTIVQEMGVGDPEAAVFVLRSRWTTPGSTNYYVIKRNFDPLTFQPSSFVNGDLWTYTTILDSQDVPISAVIQQKVDPLAYGDPVASDENGQNFGFRGTPVSMVGKFFISLTRDDMAALRYIYHPLNLAMENAPTNSFVSGGFGFVSLPGVGGGSSSPWVPFGSGGGAVGNANWLPFLISTNTVLPGGAGTVGGTNTTNFIVDVALRPGKNKIKFVKVEFDSLLGQVINPFVDSFADTFITNGAVFTQTASRVVTQPDIVFTAGDLIQDGNPIWFRVARSENWLDQSGLNRAYQFGFTGNGSFNPIDAGPGTIQSTPGMLITFNNNLPAFWNAFLGPGFAFLSESNPLEIFPIWGSFDGSTNAPVVYPHGITLEQLEQQALRGP